MRRERHERLQAALTGAGLDGAVLLGTSAVAYATGADAPGVDSSVAVLDRPVAVVVAGAPAPHLFTAYPDGAPTELPSEHLHGPLYPELDDRMPAMADALAELFGTGARLACDELTHAMLRGLPDRRFTSASAVLGSAKLCKTPDELACIRQAQRINELAMWDVLGSLRPGLRQADLTACFLRRVFELGATANALTPSGR
jgi:Xaa-Pro aminopeptidase